MSFFLKKFFFSQCSICRKYGNHSTKYCKYSNYYSRNSNQYRQSYQSNGYPNRIKNDIFLESAHRGNALRYETPHRYIPRNNSVPNNYPSPYMPRPGTPTRNFPSQISPTPNRTGNMGSGSARDSRSHGNSRSGRGCCSIASCIGYLYLFCALLYTLLHYKR